MLNYTRVDWLGRLFGLKTSGLNFSFANFAVREIKANYLAVVEDREGELEYMREVETLEGYQGIVLKIQQPNIAYIAMYQPLPLHSSPILNITKTNTPWKVSVESMAKQILSGSNPSIFSLNGAKTFQRADLIQKQGTGDRKLHSLSPVLQLSQHLKYGDMIQFLGCLGSRKTSTALDIVKDFSSKQKHTSIFVNPSVASESKRAVSQAGSWSMQAGSQNKQTDVGVYMLAVKTTYLSKLLKLAGQNVLLVIDGIRHILQAEWHMLQVLGKSGPKLQGDYNYGTPRLPPISTLNQLYVSCSDQVSSKKGGSLTCILTTDKNQVGDQLAPEVSPYTNNLKHLNSLAKLVAFPLAFSPPAISRPGEESMEEDTPSISQCVFRIRVKINEYLIEKKDNELKMRLYSSEMREAPWDYYKILDAQWWMKGLQQSKVSHILELNELLYWVALNIELELQAHWKVSCLQAFKLYREHLKEEGLKIGRSSIVEFTRQARIIGVFSPFKRDYLP